MFCRTAPSRRGLAGLRLTVFDSCPAPLLHGTRVPFRLRRRTL